MIYSVGFIFSSLGAGEILLVLVVVLLLFGAEKMPSIARSLGRALNEMRRTAGELTHAIMDKDLFVSSDDHSPEQRSRQESEKQREG